MEKLVAIGLTELSHGDGGLNNYAMLKDIVEFCNASEDQVRAAIEGLKEELGLRCDIGESGEISFSLPI
jgi:hypothetical protein